jgi:hypothetical protein
VVDVVEILVHWYAGRSKKEVAASLGVDRATVAKYVAPAVAASWLRAGSLPLGDVADRRKANRRG